MIKTHTAQSLAKYLGQKGLFEGQAYFLEGIHIWTNPGRAYIFKEHPEQRFLAPIKDIYPILKDYTKLLEPMEYEGEEIIPIKYIFGKYFKEEYFDSVMEFKAFLIKYHFIEGHTEEGVDRLISSDFQFSYFMDWEEQRGGYMPQELNALIDLGFGAIKDEESPTGYVDLFGYVCEVER